MTPVVRSPTRTKELEANAAVVAHGENAPGHVLVAIATRETACVRFMTAPSVRLGLASISGVCLIQIKRRVAGTRSLLCCAAARLGIAGRNSIYGDGTTFRGNVVLTLMFDPGRVPRSATLHRRRRPRCSP